MLQEVERGRRRQQQEQEQQQEQQQQQQQEQEDKQQQQQHEHEQKQEQDQQQQEQEKQQQQEQQQEQQPPLPAAAPPAPAACSGCGAVKAAGSSGVRLRLCRGCRQRVLQRKPNAAATFRAMDAAIADIQAAAVADPSSPLPEPLLATWPGLIEALVSAARRHPSPVGAGGLVPLEANVSCLLNHFCNAAAGRRAVLSIGGACDGGDAVGLLLDLLARAFAGGPPGCDTLSGDRMPILHALNHLALDSPAARARMRRDKAAVEAAVSGLSAAAADPSLPDEAALLMGFVAGCFAPDGEEGPAARPVVPAVGPAAAASAGVVAQPLQAAVDALPSIVAGMVQLLASQRGEFVTYAVHVLFSLVSCSAVKERVAELLVQAGGLQYLCRFLLSNTNEDRDCVVERLQTLAILHSLASTSVRPQAALTATPALLAAIGRPGVAGTDFGREAVAALGCLCTLGSESRAQLTRLLAGSAAAQRGLLEHLRTDDQPASGPRVAVSCQCGANERHFPFRFISSVRAAGLVRDLLLDPSIDADHARAISTTVLPAAAAATQRFLDALLAATADHPGSIPATAWPPQLADAVEAACIQLGDPVAAATLFSDAAPGLGPGLGRLLVTLDPAPEGGWAFSQDRESKARRVLGNPEAVAGHIFDLLQEVERRRRRQQQEQQQQEQQQQEQQQQEQKQQQQEQQQEPEQQLEQQQEQEPQHEQQQELEQQHEQQRRRQQQQQQQEQQRQVLQPPLPAATPPEPAACASCGAVELAGSGGVRLRLCRGCRQVRYCGEECMRLHWASHRPACKAAQGVAASAKGGG
ncbi:hypothetical protein MNEG_6609 [Monoraphidium neglectum]|uniref:MYND-type domain-containing protein n=1 Tax=Monoraphidium neglectum TaxID=145388 RepID=A0A0D2MLA8_9CHLO|nr:hypothetical protein MNEG_6609 [Monoraphidium neglectum]KIZ01352.1 hypothetical protein MNEG_6609 [Monoraphidium neglectum]|eukprot:XP_013900371.1 hypothetical protein MNEG_6609 [Monoraphidium neglectum]